MERGKEDFEEFPDEALNLIWARRRRALGYLCLDKDILAMGETLNKGFPVFFNRSLNSHSCVLNILQFGQIYFTNCTNTLFCSTNLPCYKQTNLCCSKALVCTQRWPGVCAWYKQVVATTLQRPKQNFAMCSDANTNTNTQIQTP